MSSWKGETTLEGSMPSRKTTEGATAEAFAFVVVWAPRDGARLGEVLFPQSGAFFGRGPTADRDDVRVGFVRQRPGKNAEASELSEPFLSRRQLKLTVSEDGVEVESVGKKALLVDGAAMSTATVREGDLVEIEGLYGLLCVRRPVVLPSGGGDLLPSTFGHADAYGIVGESAAAWALRAQVEFFGKRNAHVLVTGASGTGKELVAQAIHRISNRAKKELVARNAATFPSGLIDAELFGNMQNYPNAGMPERPGLIGQADGGTLFLDEIGELPSELQAHLLRVLDGGDYQRLGESKRRSADIRLVAATNRSLDELKEDLGARLALRLHIRGLDERREDVTLLARHLLLRIARRDPHIGQTFFDRWDGTSGEPRLTSALARALVMHAWTTHTRELESVLLRSASSSPGGELDLTEEVRRVIQIPSRETSGEVTADDIRRALARHGNVKDKAWRELRLPSRHALHRLMKKLAIPE